jgi:hypothetical protein
MMLSKRITENRRLLTAAPAIKHRMITRSKPRVFGPLACFRNELSCAAAMVKKKGERKRDVDVRKAASRSSSQLVERGVQLTANRR